MQAFKKRGTWWLPGKESVKGVLSFNEKDGLFLEADSFFKNILHNLTTSFPIIHGEADKKQYTLINSYMVGPHGERTGYKPAQALEGIHLNDIQEKIITGISFGLDDLEKWLNVTGFQQVIDKTKKGVTIHYTNPVTIPFKINEAIDGSFIFTFDVKGKITREVKIIQEVHTEFVFTKTQLTYQEALEHFSAFYQFQTFAIQHLPKIQFIKLLANQKDLQGRDITINFYFAAREAEQSFTGNYLFYRDELTNFEKIISRWFTLIKQIGPSLKILFETYFPDTWFNENSFLNQCQALETLHRTLYPVSNQESKLFKERRDKVLLQVKDTEDQNWLKDKLMFAGEPTLKERLDFVLTKIADIPSVSRLKLNADFTTKVVHNRNYYTHYGKKKKTVVDGKELTRLTVRTKFILILMLLHELGFEHSFMETQIQNGRFSNWAFLIAPHD